MKLSHIDKNAEPFMGHVTLMRFILEESLNPMLASAKIPEKGVRCDWLEIP